MECKSVHYFFFSLIILRFTCGDACVGILLLFIVEKNFIVCIYYRFFTFHLLMDIWVVSSLGQLHMKLGTFMYKSCVNIFVS